MSRYVVPSNCDCVNAFVDSGITFCSIGRSNACGFWCPNYKKLEIVKPKSIKPCNNCDHNGVCKYREDTEKYIYEKKAMLKDTPNNYIKVEFKCTYHKERDN